MCCNFEPKLLLFGTFQVVWVKVDVGSDCYQAYVYYDQGHYYWSGSTLALMFIPLVTSSFNEILTYFVMRKRGNIEDWSWKKSLKKVARHFPLVQPFVHFSYFLTLKSAKDEVVKAKKFYKKFDPKDITDANRNHYKAEIQKAAERYDQANSN